MEISLPAHSLATLLPSLEINNIITFLVFLPELAWAFGNKFILFFFCTMIVNTSSPKKYIAPYWYVKSYKSFFFFQAHCINI